MMKFVHMSDPPATCLQDLNGKNSNFEWLYKTRAILDGYFNPLVFWYQWEYLYTNQQRT